MRIISLAQENRCARERLINTLLQRGDTQCCKSATASAVSRRFAKTAEAVRVRVAALNTSLKRGVNENGR